MSSPAPLGTVATIPSVIGRGSLWCGHKLNPNHARQLWLHWLGKPLASITALCVLPDKIDSMMRLSRVSDHIKVCFPPYWPNQGYTALQDQCAHMCWTEHLSHFTPSQQKSTAHTNFTSKPPRSFGCIKITRLFVESWIYILIIYIIWMK